MTRSSIIRRLTGVEAVTEIREHYGLNIPAFIVSGDTSKVVKDARPVDNSTLMCKPVNTGRLLAAARSAISSTRAPPRPFAANSDLAASRILAFVAAASRFRVSVWGILASRSVALCRAANRDASRTPAAVVLTV